MQGEDGVDDEALIERTAGGEIAAYERLIERHQRAVYRFLVRLVGDPGIAEDAAQEAFLTVFRRAGTFGRQGSGRGWIFAIARNAGLAELRARGRRIEADTEESLEALGLAAGWGRTDPEAAASEREVRESIERALGTLSAEDREILLLRDVEGLSGEETCEALGIQLAAMKSRLHRARLRMAAAMSRGGFDERRT